MNYELHLTFLSDAAMGRGDGVIGLVDAEVEYDPRTGIPFIRGRTLKGLLSEECANLFFALFPNRAAPPAWESAARALFGAPGSDLESQGLLHVGPATLPRDLCDAVRRDIKAGNLKPPHVLRSLTGIRRQTAVDEAHGVPEEGSLRALRVLLRNVALTAELETEGLDDHALALLAACVASLRRAGTGRNRGRGRLRARLYDRAGSDITADRSAQIFSIPGLPACPHIPGTPREKPAGEGGAFQQLPEKSPGGTAEGGGKGARVEDTGGKGSGGRDHRNWRPGGPDRGKPGRGGSRR